jgi:hypothetical protein
VFRVAGTDRVLPKLVMAAPLVAGSSSARSAKAAESPASEPHAPRGIRVGASMNIDLEIDSRGSVLDRIGHQSTDGFRLRSEPASGSRSSRPQLASRSIGRLATDRLLRRITGDRVLVALALLLGAGLLLRVYFLFVWRPAITGFSDSGHYFQEAAWACARPMAK